MSIAKTIWGMIESPPSYKQSEDANRYAAVKYIRSQTYHAYIDTRPQGSGDLAVTVSPLSGVEQRCLPVPLPYLRSFFDITIWAKNRTDRRAVETALDLGEAFATLLTHFRGSVSGQEILEIVPDGSQTFSSGRPRDRSDDWTAIVEYTYTVTHEQLRGSNSAYKG